MCAQNLHHPVNINDNTAELRWGCLPTNASKQFECLEGILRNGHVLSTSRLQWSWYLEAWIKEMMCPLLQRVTSFKFGSLFFMLGYYLSVRQQSVCQGMLPARGFDILLICLSRLVQNIQGIIRLHGTLFQHSKNNSLTITPRGEHQCKRMLSSGLLG